MDKKNIPFYILGIFFFIFIAYTVVLEFAPFENMPYLETIPFTENEAPKAEYEFINKKDSNQTLVLDMGSFGIIEEEFLPNEKKIVEITLPKQEENFTLTIEYNKGKIQSDFVIVIEN